MSHKKFGPDRFSRFDVYWIQTNKQTDRQTDKPNLYIEGWILLELQSENDNKKEKNSPKIQVKRNSFNFFNFSYFLSHFPFMMAWVSAPAMCFRNYFVNI